MLSNLFYPAGWTDDSKSVVIDGESTVDGTTSIHSAADGSQIETQAVNEDELVEQLLSQFPVYGSRAAQLQGGQDWLINNLGGLATGSTASAPSSSRPEDALHDDEDDDGITAARRDTSVHSSSKKDVKAACAATDDWDDDEQNLWKDTQTTTKTRKQKQPQPLADAELRPRGRGRDWSRRNDMEVDQDDSRRPPSTTPSRRRSFSASALASRQQRQQSFNDPEDDSVVPPSDATAAADLDRQHWMPDQLCKQCYSCDTQFTVFRRRHHCRLCGQVFCNSCSAHFVPCKAGSSIRVCKMCYDQVAEKGTTMEQQQQSLASPESKQQQQQTAGPDRHAVANVFESPEQDRTQRAMLREQILLQQTDGADNDDDGSSVLNTLGRKRLKTTESPQQQQEQQVMLDWEEQKASSRLLLQRDDLYRTTIPDDSAVSKSLMKRPSTCTQGRDSTTLDSKSSGAIVTGPDGGRLGSESVREGNRHLGMTAASHLEKMAQELLRLQAPLLWGDLTRDEQRGKQLKKHWINKLLTLTTRCCSTVDPNVKKGDLLDIRPYCKIKVIPGGSYKDCAYLSGVLFRKTVSHKRMAKEIDNPRIMLLSGGIEFTRTENRIASLETLFEQEEKYMEILVGKILKHKPDVLLVGRSVSRRGQELLLQAGVVLVQHVKVSLLNRISRQTGATVISSTDHVMNQFGASVLGNCRRFRLVTFRDNEVWADSVGGDAGTSGVDGRKGSTGKGSAPLKGNTKRSIQAMLADRELSVPERQAALAANKLGEGVLDGSEAVKSGLAKRGVAQTYVMLEGCPKELGCTIVLRGASRAALKQVKAVVHFLANVAYNLRLETTYLKERGARLRPDYEVRLENTFSSSLCVDYGAPEGGRKIRPWNGGNGESIPHLESGEITAVDHQSILITSVWMTDKSQCCPAEVKGICYYSLQDVALGQFLRDSCFNLSLKCQNPNCKKSVLDHSLSFVHNDGLINITVGEMDEPLPPSPLEQPQEDEDEKESDEEEEEGEKDRPIATWTYCNNCRKVVTPLMYISDGTWKFSFGKFLEVFFYNRDAILNAPDVRCSCQLQSSAVLFFGCDKLAAKFTYEKVRPFGVFVRRNLPIDMAFHKNEAVRRLELISMTSSNLFVKFDKHIERVSREARSLFNSAVNRPEHLQTLLSELNRIGSEVDHAAKTLQEKIASVSENCRRNDDGTANEALLRFPWFARRYLFMLTTAWNEKLSAAGQAITTMKKLSASVSNRSDGVMGPNVTSVVGDPLNEELVDSMKRLRQLNEHYAQYNVTDITQSFPTLPGSGALQQDGEYDEDEFDEPDNSIDFSDGVDADVLASRRRLKSSKPMSSQGEKSLRTKPSKSLGTRRSLTDASRPSQETSLGVPPKPTPGGAVKSAITRFFNRGGREQDPYVVNLGMFGEGRPRLAPGVNGLVVPVFDDQLSTIIAYSLASAEYAKQFKYYSKMEPRDADTDGPEKNRKTVDLNSSNASAASVGSGGRPSEAFSGRQQPSLSPGTQSRNRFGVGDEIKGVERRMLVRNKSHIKHTFRDFDEKGQVACKFVCTSYWATQFHAVREVFLSQSYGKLDQPESDAQAALDAEQSYIASLSSAYAWAASGGKSGASFARSSDDRFVIKCISRTELQMFLDCAPAYFEYLSKAFFHGLPTVLTKIVGVYQLGIHNRLTGKKTMEQVAVMQNVFYRRNITQIFDLKGSLRGRFASQVQSAKEDSQADASASEAPSGNRRRGSDGWADDDRRESDNSMIERSGDRSSDESHMESESSGLTTLLDGDFFEFTLGRPMPMTDRAKAVFQMSILNDTLFLSIINVLDYSILVGVDEDNMELVVGIIDFMRQYDILKQMERVGKSLPMVVGSEAPTIIQPPLYKARFTNAMERYFMTVPNKWTTI